MWRIGSRTFSRKKNDQKLTLGGERRECAKEKIFEKSVKRWKMHNFMPS